MTGQELLLILGGIIIGFALGDAVFHVRHRATSDRPAPIAEGWDHIHHVRLIKDGDL